MAILSNINGKFAVDSSGGIQFSGQTGTSGYVLKSNGNAAPTWVDGSTVIGGPYLPLSGGTLTGATATASGISFTVGGHFNANSTTTLGGAVTIEGNLFMDGYNITSIDQLSASTAGFSGSISASGNSNSFGNTTIAALSASTGTFSASVTAAGNSNSFGTTTFSGIITAQSSSSGDYVRLYGSSGTGKWDIYGNGANLRISDNESAGILAVDTGATFGGNVKTTGAAIGTTQADGDYLAKLYTLNADGFMSLYTGQGTPLEKVRITSYGDSFFVPANNGKVGIGTTSPDGSLTIDNTSATVPQLLLTNTAGLNSRILMYDNDGGTQNASITFDQGGENQLYIATGYNSPSDLNRIYFQPGGEIAMTIRGGSNATGNAGNVGIGTTTPTARLMVKDSSDSGFDSGIAIIRSANSQTGYINMVGGAMNFNSPSIPIIFRQAGTEKMRISNSGNVTKPNSSAFSANTSAPGFTVGTTEVKVTYNSEQVDDNGNYDTTNARFTAPVTGTYLIGTANTCKIISGVTVYMAIYIRRNGGSTSYRFRGGGVDNDVNDWFGISGSVVIPLAASDYIELWAYANSGSFQIVNTEGHFYGYLIG